MCQKHVSNDRTSLICLFCATAVIVVWYITFNVKKLQQLFTSNAVFHSALEWNEFSNLSFICHVRVSVAFTTQHRASLSSLSTMTNTHEKTTACQSWSEICLSWLENMNFVSLKKVPLNFNIFVSKENTENSSICSFWSFIWCDESKSWISKWNTSKL